MRVWKILFTAVLMTCAALLTQNTAKAQAPAQYNNLQASGPADQSVKDSDSGTGQMLQEPAGTHPTGAVGNLPGHGVELTPEEKKAQLESVKKAAAEGDPSAQHQLGRAYLAGDMGEVDYGKAFELFKKAADQGNANAMSELAALYMGGLGVERNYEEGFKWYQKAADAGNMKAPRYVGVQYELGIGTEVNYRKAAENYRKAAEQGDITSQCLLGSAYERGLGVKQDYDLAAEWYLKSTERGDIVASPGWTGMGNIAETRTDGIQDLQAAIEWYRKAADAGNPDGTVGVFRLTHKDLKPTYPGRNVCISVMRQVPVYEQARNFALAAEQTRQEAHRAREAGDAKTEAYYLKKAADMGYAPAMAELGQAYLEGKIVKADPVKAQELIKAAADQGYTGTP